MSGANVFINLSYDFDSNKFGNALILSTTANNYLEALVNTDSLLTWQETEIANNNFIRTDYYKNPMINVVSDFFDNINVFYANTSIIDEFDSAAAGALIANVNTISSELIANQIGRFLQHTSNISGVTQSTPSYNEDFSIITDYPDYEKSISVGQQVLRIVYETDGIQNGEPILGNFTSLFIEDDLQELSITLGELSVTMNSTISVEEIENPNTDPEAPPTITVYTSNISESVANVFYTYANTANNLIWNRRLHDENFYRKSNEIVDVYHKVRKLRSLGKIETYLVENYIGTDSYNEKLAANT